MIKNPAFKLKMLVPYCMCCAVRILLHHENFINQYSPLSRCASWVSQWVFGIFSFLHRSPNYPGFMYASMSHPLRDITELEGGQKASKKYIRQARSHRSTRDSNTASSTRTARHHLITRPQPKQALPTMRLSAIFLALAPAALGLQDGFYTKTIHPNGTLETYDAITGVHVETLHEGPLVEAYRQAFAEKASAEKKRRQLAKRFVSCWGTALDHSGVDSAVQGWKDNLRSQSFGLCSDPGRTKSVAVYAEGMQVYYCINRPSYCGDLDLIDFNHALLQMDQNCAHYTASYYQWDGGSPEIVGKANQNTPICLG